MRRAYILSEVYGTVQIGDTVFQPCTGTQYKVSSYPRKYKKVILVKDKSMESAKKALQD